MRLRRGTAVDGSSTIRHLRLDAFDAPSLSERSSPFDDVGVPEIIKAAMSDRQAGAEEEIRRTVGDMLARIEREGIDAVRQYSVSLDGWSPATFRVSPETIAAAPKHVLPSLAERIEFALDQVRRFAEAQRGTLTELKTETLPGVVLGHRLVPVQSVGAYVPGGRYPLIATAFMTIAVPRVAGVERIVAAAPPYDAGGIHPAALYAMARSGADEIFCIGGVQALAMLAFGIDEAPPVDMLVGPGNAYVTEAKRQLFGRVGIDLTAGPSEILVIASPEADAKRIAVDLLAQAEHGPTSRTVLVTWSEDVAYAVLAEVERILPTLRTSQTARAAWEACGEIILVEDRYQARQIADEVACEHVHVHASHDDREFFFARLHNFGSLFLGEETTVVFGDKAIGTNHCLPTGGAARFTGGLWVGSFLKVLSFQEVTSAGAAAVAPVAAAIAAAEQLDAHSRSATARTTEIQVSG